MANYGAPAPRGKRETSGVTGPGVVIGVAVMRAVPFEPLVVAATMAMERCPPVVLAPYTPRCGPLTLCAVGAPGTDDDSSRRLK